MANLNVIRLDRTNLSETAADAVREMIIDGRLAPGERVNEVRLAAALGVSRTPLREGLRMLAAEGALDASPNLGFFVRPLTIEEFGQLYDIRPLLDPEALRLAGIPAWKRLEHLEKLNRRFSTARDHRAAIALDDEWHHELVADCPNKVLLELIRGIELRTRRYEMVLMRESANVALAVEDHARILAALRQGDLDAACRHLKRNLEYGRAIIIEWLKQRG